MEIDCSPIFTMSLLATVAICRVFFLYNFKTGTLTPNQEHDFDNSK